MVTNKAALLKLAATFCDESETNYVPASLALRPELAGMRIYEYPLAAVAASDDPLFDILREPGIIGSHFLPPREWLPEARSVISLFLPFTDTVKKANRREPVETPPEWLHGRIEGQQMLGALAKSLCHKLRKAGYPSLAPTLDTRFWSSAGPANVRKDGTPVPGYTSNWSERHVAYVAGLGTFGLTRALITEKGSAGRFINIVTTLPLEPDIRPYTRFDEYCNLCGACIRKCPVQAISLQEGKDQAVCTAHINKTMIKYKPRYGCGKCNVGVPCESRIPCAAAVRPT